MTRTRAWSSPRAIARVPAAGARRAHPRPAAARLRLRPLPAPRNVLKGGTLVLERSFAFHADRQAGAGGGGHRLPGRSHRLRDAALDAARDGVRAAERPARHEHGRGLRRPSTRSWPGSSRTRSSSPCTGSPSASASATWSPSSSPRSRPRSARRSRALRRWFSGGHEAGRAGETGVLYVRGPHVMVGYWRKARADRRDDRRRAAPGRADALRAGPLHRRRGRLPLLRRAQRRHHQDARREGSARSRSRTSCSTSRASRKPP